MAEAFLDEALNRLITYGVVAVEGNALRFTDEWVGYLTRRLSYTMRREEVKNRIVECLGEFYKKKGYHGELRFDLAWIKQIFTVQFKGMGEEQRSLLREFIEGVGLLDV
ncbi:MAG: hypothetical protein QW514_01775 [Thermoprotei archaeon]